MQAALVSLLGLLPFAEEIPLLPLLPLLPPLFDSTSVHFGGFLQFLQ